MSPPASGTGAGGEGAPGRAGGDAVSVRVNGEERALEGGATLGALVDGLGRGRRGLAVAVNEEVVPRSRWDETRVHGGDRVEVLSAAQGG